MTRTLVFCGAFNGHIKMRKNETPEQARERAERLMQAAVDRVKALDVGIGVDIDVQVVVEP